MTISQAAVSPRWEQSGACARANPGAYAAQPPACSVAAQLPRLEKQTSRGFFILAQASIRAGRFSATSPAALGANRAGGNCGATDQTPSATGQRLAHAAQPMRPWRCDTHLAPDDNQHRAVSPAYHRAGLRLGNDAPRMARISRNRYTAGP